MEGGKLYGLDRNSMLDLTNYLNAIVSERLGQIYLAPVTVVVRSEYYIFIYIAVWKTSYWYII